MYNKAISRLEEEIAHRTKLINNIKRFTELTLDEKIQTIKECTLRYERDTMPQILQKDFKSKLLREHAEVKIGVNDLTLTFENYTVDIGLYNGKIVKIENCVKYKDQYSSHEDYDEELMRKKEIVDECKECINKYITFIEKPNYKNYKEINKKITHPKYLFSRKSILKYYAKEDLNQIKSTYNYFTNQLNELLEYPVKLEKIKAENDEFLELIKEDIKCFEDNGYSIYYKFKNIW